MFRVFDQQAFSKYFINNLVQNNVQKQTILKMRKNHKQTKILL